MGQYYKAIILGPQNAVEFIRLWMCPFSYNNGLKLMEHSYLNNPFVSAFEYQISCDGPFYMSRVVWAGDYAEKEPSGKSLYEMASEIQDDEHSKLCKPPSKDTSCYRYIVNHTKKLYIDKTKLSKGDIHPLPLLISEGNAAGGADYSGRDEELCGTWARDLLSLERSLDNLEEYTLLKCWFNETY